MLNNLSSERSISVPLDTGENRSLGFSYFCNFDELPGVVACCTKSNPTLNESCYDPDTLKILERI